MVQRRVHHDRQCRVAKADGAGTQVTSSTDLVELNAGSNATIQTIAIGGAGAGTFAIGGSFTKNAITNTVEALATGGAAITADTSVFLTATEAPTIKSLSAAGRGRARQRSAPRSRSTTSPTASTRGRTARRLLPSLETSSWRLDTAEIDGISVGGGGGGTVGIAGSVAVNTVANGVEASITGGTTTADGTVAVTAAGQSTLFGIVGTISGGGTAGIGGSVTINTFSNTTNAFVAGGATVTGRGNATAFVPKADGTGASESAAGVAVIATGSDDMEIITANLSGGGAAGLAATISITNAGNIVRAYIDASTINPSNASHNLAQAVRVRALNIFKTNVVAGGLAFGGSAGVGATTDVQIVANTVDAHISGGANVRARNGGVAVTGYSVETIKTITVTGAGGGAAGVAGSVPIISVGSTTGAAITGSTVFTTGDLSVIAHSNLTVGGDPQGVVAGAVAVGGAAGIGAAVAVLIASPVTTAHISGSTTDASGITDVRADSTETLRVLAISAALGGYAGIGGAVIVDHAETSTQASIDGVSTVNANLSSGTQDVIVEASDNLTVTDIAGSAAAGLVGAAASIDVISVKNATVAFIGSGAVVNAGRDVKVLATQTRDVSSVVIGFGGGLVGLQGSIAVVNIGSNFSADGASNVPNQGGGNALGSMSGSANTQANGSGGSKVGGLAGSDPTATSATSRANTATSGLTVAGDFGTGAPAAKGTSASILGSVFAGRDVIVMATDTTELNVTAGSVAAGFVGIGVAASIANVEANTEAFISGGTISAGRNVTVSAHYALNQNDGSCSLGSLSDCMGRGFAGGGGVVALFGAVIVIHDSSTQSAYIAGSTHLVQAAAVTVDAGASAT